MAAETANEEVDDFLAELDDEFGKKKRVKGDSDIRKERNLRFHEGNKPLDKVAGGQLPQEAAGYYSWSDHQLWVLRTDDDDILPPRWIPECRVTLIVHQKCAVCLETSWYTGHEYIRFRRNYQNHYKTLGGETVSSAPTVTRQIGDVDPELITYGLPDGTPLQEAVQEIIEEVLRCPKCVMLERACSDLWYAATRPHPQADLPGLDELLKEIP